MRRAALGGPRLFDEPAVPKPAPPSPYDPAADNILDPLLDPSVTNAYCDAEGCLEPVPDEPFHLHLGGDNLIFCSRICLHRTYMDFYDLAEDEGPSGDTVVR